MCHGHLFPLLRSYHSIVRDKESFFWNITPAQSPSVSRMLPFCSWRGGKEAIFTLWWKYWCKENMSVQNKRGCIMRRQMVLRRILSNADDRQADRLAQTLSLKRPWERPGPSLSLSGSSLSLSCSLSLSLFSLSGFLSLSHVVCLNILPFIKFLLRLKNKVFSNFVMISQFASLVILPTYLGYICQLLCINKLKTGGR